MRIVINRDLCQGHAVCVEEAPEVFALDADGALVVLQERPPEALLQKLRVAAKYCPTGAIAVVEETE